MCNEHLTSNERFPALRYKFSLLLLLVGYIVLKISYIFFTSNRKTLSDDELLRMLGSNDPELDGVTSEEIASD